MLKMSTIEMIQKIKDGQRAQSKTLDLTVESDIGIKVVIDKSYEKNVTRHLPLSGMVLSTCDWILEPEQTTDMNKVFTAIKNNHGATLVLSERNISYYFNAGNKDSLLDYLNFSEVMDGKWLLGEYSKEELKAWGYLE